MARDRRSISRAQLSSAQEQFIQAWGQMGSSWGISRTMAEAHALLYIVGGTMNTDEVMERLRISRGNASMTLRSLVEWGIVSRVHRRGDRKEYFQAEQDVWALARQIIRERLRREILPTLTTLHEIRDVTQTDARERRGGDDGVSSVVASISAGKSAPGGTPTLEEVSGHNERLDALLDLVQMIDKLGERFVGLEGKGLKVAASVLSKIV